MIKQLSFFLLSLLLINSCKFKSNLELPENLLKRYPIAFSQNNDSHINGIVLESELRTNIQGDTLLFYALIDNQTSEVIRIPSNNFQLKTLQGHKSHPVNHNTGIIIPANTSKSVCLKFTPINHRFLYYSTGYRGDVDSCYTLTIDCLKGKSRIKHPSIIINYDGIEDENRPGVHRVRKNDMFVLFEIEKLFEDKEYRKKNKMNISGENQYVNSDGYDSRPKNIHLSETEILIDGTIFNTKFYTLKGNLFLKIKIINHGKAAIYFHPDSLNLNCEGIIYLPKSKNKERGDLLILDDGDYVLKKGQRYETLISYGSFNSERFTLDLSSIKHQLNHKMFSEMKFIYRQIDHQKLYDR